MINYAKDDIELKLDNDLEEFYNKERYRLTVCKAMYSPNKDCKKYAEKIKQLTRYVGMIQLKRG